MYYSIAIDGPAGAGKSTVAKLLAQRLGYVYVDTGAMYRAMALFFLRLGLSSDKQGVPCAGGGTDWDGFVAAHCREASITIDYDRNGSQVVLLNGENVNALIRTEEVSAMASAVAANPAARKQLVALQKKIAEEKSVVMDGRDIGTCVLPGATLKIFLTASVSVRASRRFLELQEKGAAVPLEQIEENIRQRDAQDIHRAASPLRRAGDAVAVDTSDKSISQVIDEILTLAEQRGCRRKR